MSYKMYLKMSPPWFLFANTSSTISKEKINWTQILFTEGLKTVIPPACIKT